MDCTFCKIVEGVWPSWRVYEDEHTVAFLDKGQVTRGHTLVIPRRHAANIWALSGNEAQAVMRSVHRVARLLREKLDLRGLNIAQSNGKAAWQEVLHYHVHLIPRYGDDGFNPPWRATSPSGELFSRNPTADPPQIAVRRQAKAAFHTRVLLNSGFD